MGSLKRWIPDRRWLDKRRTDAIAIGSLILFFIAFFPQAVFGGQYLLRGDSLFYSYPMHTVAWRMLREGSLPLWSPYTLCGYPLLSMTNLGLGYPLTWGHAFLPGHVAEQIYVLAPFLLAPIFTYLYLRTIGRSPLASMLGGLSFGYGGMMAAPLGNSGMMTNSALWLPLLLIGIEKSRTSRFIPALLLATAAYSMSVLAGFAQAFIYAGLLAFGYALWLALTGARSRASGASFKDQISTLKVWRPVLLIASAGLLAMGISAFQILETARAARRSVRHSLDYETFTQGSLTPDSLWRSFVAPWFYWVDMHAYVPPLVLGLAIVAVLVHFRKRDADRRVFFWLLVAPLALILMLGGSTPVYRIVYRIPILNLLRMPSRQTFLWTFAVSVLSAYGWDIVAGWLRQKRSENRWSNRPVITSVILLIATVVVGILWWRRIETGPWLPDPRSFAFYVTWKIVFVLVSLFALWQAALIVKRSWRFPLVVITVLVLCFVEPSAIVTRWWGHGFDAARFSTMSGATQFLKQFPAEQGRVYTRVDLMSEQFSPPRFDSPNLSAVWELQNVGGYEPMVLERYSRALGNVGMDTVYSLKTGAPDNSLLSSESHVLDILNTTFIVSYPNLDTALKPIDAPRPSGVPGEILPQISKTLTTSPILADSLDLVTSLTRSVEVPDDALVARVRIFTAKGAVIEHELRAGKDTAEWAHDRPDVRPIIKHRLPAVFEQTMVNDPSPFPAYRFKTSVRFAEPLEVVRVEISNVSKTAGIAVHSALLSDSRIQKSFPLYSLASDFLKPVYERDHTLILQNTRALPRAWLVTKAEAVDGEEALKRIRGESSEPFDPRLTALLEVTPRELPELPGGTLTPDAAKITHYGPNSFSVDTNAAIPTVLVLSEMFYPGWTATVDGDKTQIYITNFLLRGVALPAGQHRVELRYTAPGARNGAIISAITLIGIVALAVVDRRQRMESVA